MRKFYLCGPSAAANGIGQADLLTGVTLFPFTMTAHALLQQQGFTVNPL